MKKQRNQFLILLIVLVALVGGYFGLQYYNEYAAEKESAEADAAVEWIYEIAEDSVTHIEYSYNDEVYAFVKEEDTWKYEADPSLNIKQTSIELMESKIENLQMEDKVENATDLSQYGLDEPARYFSFEADGQTYTFNVGDYNSFFAGYYICEPDSDTVYMVTSSIVTVYNKDLEDVVEEEEESVSDSDAE